jgi:transcriptional regulator with XRE-family HTH domain
LTKKERILIKAKMLELNITQAQMARQYGCTRQNINNVLTGKENNLLVEEWLLKWLHQNTA